MIIDLSFIRNFACASVDTVLFEFKMKGFKINKWNIISAASLACYLLANCSANAFDGSINYETSREYASIMEKYGYPSIFAALETLKQCTFSDLVAIKDTLLAR